MTDHLQNALLEAYWIIDAMPGQSSNIDRLKEAITDAILNGKTARMEHTLDEAEIAIGSALSSVVMF